MKLYEKFLQTIYPERKIFHDSKSFMIYEIDNENDMSIYDLYSDSVKQFVNILRFVDFKQPKNMFCKVQINTKKTEYNISLYYKMGFSIYKTDKNNVFMRVSFETWQNKTRKFFNPTNRNSKSLKGVN